LADRLGDTRGVGRRLVEVVSCVRLCGVVSELPAGPSEDELVRNTEEVSPLLPVCSPNNATPMTADGRLPLYPDHR
jgi:hypothetical protein